ncbi:hypothetical protein [Nonomuraea sp. NPDC003754]
MSSPDHAMPSEGGVARLALAEQAALLADTAYHLVPTTREAGARLGGFVAAAAPLVRSAHRVLELAVVFERVSGTSWEQIGVELGISRRAAQERFGQAERDFRERFLLAWLRPERAPESPLSPGRLAGVAGRLRASVTSRRAIDEDPSATFDLVPMSDLERSSLIARAGALLRSGSTPAGDRRDLERGLCRRKVELYEDLVAAGMADADLLEALAGVRARLTELQD